MDLSGWAQQLEASGLGLAMRDGVAYPITNVIHLFAMALVVVPMLLLDLRLLGFGREFPLRRTVNTLRGCALAGILMALASGIAMFASDAGALFGNPAMRIKLALLALALFNAVVFHVAWQRRLSLDTASQPSGLPNLARAQLLLSIGLWLAIPTFGRWIAYV